MERVNEGDKMGFQRPVFWIWQKVGLEDNWIGQGGTFMHLKNDKKSREGRCILLRRWFMKSCELRFLVLPVARLVGGSSLLVLASLARFTLTELERGNSGEWGGKGGSWIR